jgi:hypothetical protein
MEETDSFQYSHSCKFVLICIYQRSFLMGMSFKVCQSPEPFDTLGARHVEATTFRVQFQSVGTASTNKQLNISTNKQTQWTFLRYYVNPTVKNYKKCHVLLSNHKYRLNFNTITRKDGVKEKHGGIEFFKLCYCLDGGNGEFSIQPFV